jgi:radical SAM protein with 4Fe4S-binding SPASM domain
MATEVQFSHLKLLGYMEWIEAYRRGQNIPPLTVEFHLTNHCQHDCWFCSDAIRRSVGRETLPREVVERTLRDMASMGVKSVVFEGGGEPTLSRHFDMAFGLAAELGMACGLTTNGGLLGRPARAQLVAGAASWVRISLDAATSATHEIMHAPSGDKFDEILASAAKLRALNQDLVLGWSFIISEQNAGEILLAAQKARELGFSYIDIKPLLVDRKSVVMPDGVAEQISEVLKMDGSETDCAHPFRVYAARLDGSKPRKFSFSVCHSHRFIGNIAATGDVYVCCAHAMQEGSPDRALPREKVVLGNIKDRPFREIWESDSRMALAKLYQDKETVKKCPTCRFGHHNELLEAVMGDVKFSPFI